MKSKLNKEVSERFYNTLNENCDTLNWSVFYKQLSSFLINHENYFGRELITKFGLKNFLHLDPKKYIVNNPEQSLVNERKRLLSQTYEDKTELVRYISCALFNMFEIFSKKTCPHTGDNLRIIKLKVKDGEEFILLECPSCYWTEWPTGQEYKGFLGELVAISKEELEDFFKKHPSCL